MSEKDTRPAERSADRKGEGGQKPEPAGDNPAVGQITPEKYPKDQQGGATSS